MSSFKRKGSAKSQTLPSYPGTRPCPTSPSTTITSTGIPSLDDILGGGLPLSCSMLILAPDLHSSYGSLVQKYFVAEGLASGHRVVVVDSDPENFVRDLMWYQNNASTAGLRGSGGDRSGHGANNDAEAEQTKDSDQEIKIAWRYEQMKQFQTSVEPMSASSDDYYHTLDLSMRVPGSVIEAALQAGNLMYLEVASGTEKRSTTEVLCKLFDMLISQEVAGSPIRICIPSLGSPFWGSIANEDLSFFLYSLRSGLRRHPTACASVGLPPHISTEAWGGAGWRQRLGWLVDAAVCLEAFSADPSLSGTFPSHHGIVRIETVPKPHMLVAPSDRCSSLRGLSATSSASGGGGENNLAFKCTRKRLVIETLHLDLEGGVSERRTTTTPVVPNEVTRRPRSSGAVGHIVVGVEGGADDIAVGAEGRAEDKPKKKKKAVAFRSDRPDLYDF